MTARPARILDPRNSAIPPSELVRKRRHRVWRQVALFLLGAAAVVMISMTNRDAQSVDTCRASVRTLVDSFEHSLKTVHALPPMLPLPNADVLRMKDHYVYNAFYTGALAARGEAAICYCESPHQMYLRQNGRHVVLFDGQHVRLKWMSEREFLEKAADLGVRLAH
jgi:hypothetical protein